MTPSQAWKLFLPELQAVTVDMWNEEDFEDEPARKLLAAQIEAGVINDAVLDEVYSCLTRDWCSGRIMTAALTVLAANGKLQEFDPNAVRTRKPVTRVLLGKRWEV